jgi:hypothetical protein
VPSLDNRERPARREESELRRTAKRLLKFRQTLEKDAATAMRDWTYIEQISNRVNARGARAAAQAAVAAEAAEAAEAEHGAVPERRAAVAPWALGSIVAGRYVLKAHLGRGRYGPIYKALDRTLSGTEPGQEHHVALHELHERLLEAAGLHDRLEAIPLHPQSWSHPNIVRFVDFGRDGGKCFLVTELLEGASLRFILDDAAPELLSRDECFALLGAVGDALKYAHAKGAIHGDLRPEKVFVTQAYTVKVLDFLPQSERRTSPFFVEDAAPGGADPDPRDDVYGLACLAYELLSGKHPFNANSPLEALRAGAVPAPIPGLPRERWQALAQGLALRREQRSGSVGELLRGLGVTGTETLQPASTAAGPPIPAAAPRPTIAEPARPATTPAATPAVRSPAPESGVPVLTDAMASGAYAAAHPIRGIRLERVEAPPRRAGNGRVIVGVVVVAALGVAVYLEYDSLRERVAGAITIVHDLARGASPAPAGGDAAVLARPRVASVSERPRSDLAPAGDQPVATVAEPPPAVSPAAEPAAPPPAPDAATPRQEATALPAPIPVDPPEPARFEFAGRSLTVSESETTARVVIRRVGARDMEASVVWWTSDDTATADDDYADLGARIETFAAGEESRTIFIPLVADVLPERRERLFVNLGPAGEQSPRLEPSLRLEIVIVDDDS